jgi:hypothetical protein
LETVDRRSAIDDRARKDATTIWRSTPKDRHHSRLFLLLGRFDIGSPCSSSEGECGTQSSPGTGERIGDEIAGHAEAVDELFENFLVLLPTMQAFVVAILGGGD